jgi:drug/metabolite transporter (DMT)-like permease
MLDLSSSSLLLGEAIMSLYPILVRTIKTDLLTHTLTRLLTTVIICYPFISVSMGNIVGNLSHHIVSILYILHIYASYIGFLNLDVGVALTLFYTYPLINVLIHECFLVKNINWHVISYFIVSFIGVFLITKHDTSYKSHNMYWFLGVGAMILAAISESIIYLFYKTSTDTDPFNMLFIMCFSGSIILSLIWLYKKLTTNTPFTYQNDVQIPFKLFLANAILGVCGYLLRFYSLPYLTTEWFSILSFSGIIFGYLYGWIFFGETINFRKIIGTILIILSVYKVKTLGY